MTDEMTETERLMADNVYAAMMRSMHDSDRSQQAQEFRVGVSDLGFCSERTRRMLAREVPEEIDMLPAFVGTWLGEGIERSIGVAYPEAIIQSEVTVPLKGELNEYEISGHPDVIFPNGVVLDVKTGYGLSVAAKTGMTDQSKKFQRHLYAYGAFLAGMFDPDLTLNDITVGNIWMDRSAQERRVLVKTEPFDLQVVDEAAEWLDEAVYAWQNGETARKEPAREMCAKVCGYYEPCRGSEAYTEGLLTDPEVLAAVSLDQEGKALEKQAKLMRREAKDTLQGVAGSTGEYEVYWTTVAAAKIEAFERAPYDRLTVRPVKP